ncbi:uncharacterized protein atk [Epargyreus clarus]|uniref:uncharacterized protein atk n=1 Tax=Epargyreus clarus TaxID=520877 RepID=UPI003C2FD804
MDFTADTTFKRLILLFLAVLFRQCSLCPVPDTIIPCICTNRNDDVQIWCTHSDLPQVVKGIQGIGEYTKRPIDELIIENNYLPSLPGKLFQRVKILRLMLRHNGLERVSAAWLESQETSLVEIFIVENDLTSIPTESLTKLQHLQAITIQSNNLKRIAALINMPRLRYINIQSENLNSINEHTFKNLPNLEKLFIQGSINLQILKENSFYNLPKLKKLEITDCGINMVHMRALSLLPELNELSFSNNKISDATMVGRATRDLPMLSILNLNYNLIDKLSEGAFVDQPMLETLLLSNNRINIIHHGAFHRVPKLRAVDLNYNDIVRIHPESFLQQSGSGVEELYLIGNKIMHISEFRSLLDALPRLKFLDLSGNLLQEIPRGALRGHPSLERLHLNRNSIKVIQAEAFVAMPALRELHLSNNSLSNLYEGPFWNLPALKGLDLSNNQFQRLQPKLLYNLPALRRIDLSNNQLNIIDPMTFMESPLLEYVNVSRNALVSIHPATFRNLAKLYEIDASYNRLIEFVPGLPRGLEKLYLQRNQITNFPAPPSPDLDLPSLRTLDISNNGIQKLPYAGMKTLHNLRRLYMKRNGLRQIDSTTFSDLTLLEILDVSENQIFSIHPKSFNKLGNLKLVNLHGNNIDNFDFVSIQDNGALSTLDFSKNKLRNISPSMVSRAIDVEVFNISSNNLNELPSTLNMLSKLKILDASYNHIKHFDGNSINNIQTLKEVRIPSNRIMELRAGSFQNIQNLETINMENNQIEVIHSLAISNLPSVMSIYLSRNHIIDIPDRVFSNLPKLRILELQGNRLQFISLRAFENIPLLQYLNMSNNQLTNIDNTGIRQLPSLEVLDLSFNKITKITKESFQFMEWLVELNLENNLICYINGQPFDAMPRLKVLSLRYNKLTSVSENIFANLRNNIAILDIDGNPLICNCALIWLKSWLSESTAIGPKCSDGTYVKGMPFTRDDCLNFPANDDFGRSCITHENEALLPNLASSQVFTSLDKIKDFATQLKNNYVNKQRPSPEESEYFYDEYVDYPYNETLIDSINDQLNDTDDYNHANIGNTPTLYASMKNTSNKNSAITTNAPSSGFTFFGMPLPPINMGKLLSTGRKMDWSENKQQYNNKYHVTEPPRFETGGFTPMLPETSSGFMPIPNPTQMLDTHRQIPNKQGSITYSNKGPVDKSVAVVDKLPPNVQNNTTHIKIKSETHELQAFVNDNNSTHIAYNRTKNIQEHRNDPSTLRHYNFKESNLTITQVTEKEGIITTDTSNDMGMQPWLETSTTPAHTIPPPSTVVTLRPPMKKHIDNLPTALSASLSSTKEDLERRNHSTRPATITKVNMPIAEHYDLRDSYLPVTNREGKTRFPGNNSGNKPRHADDKEWYYKNYNNSNLEPYVAPGINNNSKANILQHISIIIIILCSVISITL